LHAVKQPEFTSENSFIVFLTSLAPLDLLKFFTSISLANVEPGVQNIEKTRTGPLKKLAATPKE